MDFDLLGIQQKIGDMQRLREIVRLLIKHGYGHYIRRLNLDDYLPFGDKLFKRIEPEEPQLPPGKRLKEVFEELGPTFVKFGQLLSLRTDVLPPEVAVELEKLQSDVQPMDWPEARVILEAELGQKWDRVFSEIEKSPRGSASLAQAHRAVLKDGQAVIIKIQRQGIEDKIQRDIQLMRYLAELMEKYLEDARRYNPTGLVDEFASSINQELNFINEAINIHRFQKNFREIDEVKIPGVFWEYTGDNVLIMESIEGVTLSTCFEGKKKLPCPGEKIARIGTEVVFKQIFEDGFFHADPHPGNIMVTPAGELALVDFGIVGRLDHELMEELAAFLVSVDKRDTRGAIKVLGRLGFMDHEVANNEIRRHLLTLIDKYFEVPIRQISAEDIFGDLNQFLNKYDVNFPPEFYMLVKTVITMESVAEKLDPGFELSEVARPYLEKLVKRYRGIQRLSEEAPGLAFDMLKFIRDLPENLHALFRRVEKGNLRVEFEHRGLEAMATELRKDSNRIALAMILSGLIIGSSLLVASGRGPELYGFPILGVTGFVVAGVFGLILVISIFRSRRF